MDKIRLMNEIIDRIIPFPDTFSDALHLKKIINSLVINDAVGDYCSHCGYPLPKHKAWCQEKRRS